MCAALGPLLPLLSLGKLEPDEDAQVREHVATCTFCRSQLVEFDTVRDALRRYEGPAGRVPDVLLPLEVILDAVDGAGSEDHDDGDDQLEVTPLGARLSTLRPVPDAARRRGRERLSALGALAAVLILAVLAETIFGWLRPASAGMTVPGVGTLVVFRLPAAGSQPRFIVAGRDGNLWFTENERIGRITPKGVITEFPLSAGVIPNGLAAGPDGTIWFTDILGKKIGRLSPRDGSVTEFPLPNANVSPSSIVAGPDDNLWFGAGHYTGSGGDQPEIGRITPAGTISEFRPPAGTPPPTSLAVGPDGNLWFTNIFGGGYDVIGRITPGGRITEYPVPTFNAEPGAIVAGRDGNLWFTEWAWIGRITPKGVVTEFPVPDGTPSPTFLTAGPDGNIWFVVGDDSTLGRITPQGAVALFDLPTGVTPGDITLGPDGNLWFTDTAANTVDCIEFPH
jgi:virginiamycin B lyase